MKKFLSMLLALSVVFTYTFGAAGSVFAATYDNTDKYIEAVNAAEKTALDYEAGQYAVAVAQAKTAKTVDVVYGKDELDNDLKISVDTAYYLTQLDAVYAAIQNDIKAQTLEMLNAKGTDTPEGKIDFTAPAYKTKTASEMLDMAKNDQKIAGVDVNCATTLIAAQLEINKAEAIKNVGTVKTDVYSTTKLEKALTFKDVNGKTVECYSAKDYADALKADYVAVINTYAYDKDSDNLAKVGGTVKKLADYIDTIIADEDKDGVYTMKASIKKAADEDAENAEKAAKIAAAKTAIQGIIATEYAKAIKAENYAKAEWDKLVSAYTTVENYLAENHDYSKGAFVAGKFPTDYVFNKDSKTKEITIEEKTTGYINAVANAELYKAAVADVKAIKDDEGRTKYDEKSVDEAATKKVEAEYAAVAKTVAAKTVASVKADLVAALTPVTYATAMEKAKAIKAAQNAYDAAKYDAAKKSTTYYPVEYAKYKAALDAYVVAVNAAVNADDMTKASNNLKDALKEINTADKVVYADTTTDKAATAEKNAQATAAAYVATLNAGKDLKDQITYTGADVTEFLKLNGARDAAGIVALYDALKADIAKAETPDQAAAAAKAVQDKINAIPASLTLTLANEASVLAVKAEYDALSKAAKAKVLTTTPMDLALTQLAKLADAEITAAAKAINKDIDGSAVKIADKAALKALDAKCETYKNNYGKAATNAAFAPAGLATVKTAEAKNVAELVKALPTTITKDDKAAVEGARAAYDAYVVEYNDLASGVDAVAELKAAGVNLEKLQAAEATIAELTKYTDKDVKVAVYDMAKTTSYTKPAKNKVKLTAKADVTEVKENGYTVKYRFYQKGPKKTAYKLWKTTTSETYTFNGLKKGTHYFKVKVSVYDAEGKLVAYKYTNVRTLKIK